MPRSLVLAAVATFTWAVSAAPSTAEAAGCGTLRVAATGTVTIVSAPTGAQEIRRRARADTAYFVQARRTNCTAARQLLLRVVPAGNERAAVIAAGYRVARVQRRLRFGRNAPWLHRVTAAKGRARIAYVRPGLDVPRGLGIGGGLGARTPLDCAATYHVLGVRGSGEGLTGPFGMGATVGSLADRAVAALGPAAVRTVSIPYPATSVGVLAQGNLGSFMDSMYDGQRRLQREIERITDRCRLARIAVIGYSQGAGATSEALRMLGRRARTRIRVAVLIADPYSRPGGGDDVVLNPLQPNEPAQRVGQGLLGSRASALVADRYFDYCVVNDIVCDARPGWQGKITQAFLAPIHTEYATCCAGTPLLSVLAGIVARHLQAPE